MVGWSRRNRESRERRNFVPPCSHLTGCPCFCHYPETPEYKAKQKANNWHDTKLLLGVSLFFILFIMGAAYCLPSEHTEYIEVGGKMCIVKFKQTGTTSTGGSIGHNEA